MCVCLCVAGGGGTPSLRLPCRRVWGGGGRSGGALNACVGTDWVQGEGRRRRRTAQRWGLPSPPTRPAHQQPTHFRPTPSTHPMQARDLANLTIEALLRMYMAAPPVPLRCVACVVVRALWRGVGWLLGVLPALQPSLCSPHSAALH